MLIQVNKELELVPGDDLTFKDGILSIPASDLMVNDCYVNRGKVAKLVTDLQHEINLAIRALHVVDFYIHHDHIFPAADGAAGAGDEFVRIPPLHPDDILFRYSAFFRVVCHADRARLYIHTFQPHLKVGTNVGPPTD